MIAILATMGIGGTLGVVIGFLNNPAVGYGLKYGSKILKLMAQGKHLSAADKKFIKEYNNRKVIYDGHDYTKQFEAMNIMKFH